MKKKFSKRFKKIYEVQKDEKSSKIEDVIVKVNVITCANVDGTNAATLSLWIDGVGTTVTGVTGTGLATAIYLAKTVNVPADDILVVIDRPLYLMENDILKGGASAAGDLDLYIAYEVINDA